MTPLGPDDDLTLNPTLSVNLVYRLVKQDGEVDVSVISIRDYKQLSGFLMAINTDNRPTLDLELEPDVLEELRARQILITHEEKTQMVSLTDWSGLRNTDIVIATYPKSGTTWMQMIVYQLISDGSLDFPHMNTLCPLLPDSGFVTRLLRQHVSAVSGPRFYKTHGKPALMPRKCKFIYVFRNPKDVLVSYYHHLSSTNEFRGSLDQFAARFLTGQILFGSWFEHLQDWWPRRNDPNVLFVAYESLLEHFDSTFAEIGRFCDIQVDPDRMAAIKQACSFEFMKQLSHKLAPHPDTPKSQFFRKGTLGGGAAELSKTTAQLVDRRTQRLIRTLDPTRSASNMPDWWDCKI